ncbi:MAG: patatin-like phospholipase family protein, partial [Rhizonema sp. NSF051]|nr:patatin-like phospholipase family protein [Rhizonema sp. NSF051]
MTNSVPTQLRSVLTFDGQDDYIDFGKNDIGGVFAKGSSAFTISGWVNPHQLTNKATTYGTHNVFFARSSDRYSDNFEFGISESGNLDVYIDEKIDNVIKTFGNGELTIGQWHSFAIVFNAGQLTIYLDEHEYTGSRRGTSLNNATSSVTLGATLHNYNYFTGQLANISVWNYPCTGAEIQRHLHGAIVGNELGLVAYWMLNEGTGATIRDSTANAHGGILHGNPTWDLAQLPFGIAQSSNEDLPIKITTVLAPNERQAKRRKGTIKDAQKSADSIQTGISSQLEPEETETAQTGQSEVIVKIPPPEQPQTLAQAELEKTIDKGRIQTGISSQLEPEETETAQTGQSEVIVTIPPPEQAQTFAQEELEKTLDKGSIQTGINSQLQAEETETAQTGQSEVIVTIPPPEQAQILAQEELEKTLDKGSIQTGINSQLQAEETKTAQTGQSEVIVTIQPPKQPQTLAQEEPEKTMNTEANPKYKILAIDGGGIRGIIPAMILAEIEKRTLKPISSLFDLIAGTSTGGILALGLTKPGFIEALDGSPIPEYSAENLLQIYLEYGVEIFYEPFLERILGPIEDIFIQPKYSSEGREEILRQYFGNAPLENNLKEVFV